MTAAQTVVHRDPGIVSGMPVFVGTRVPVDYLKEVDTVDAFLE